MDDLKPGDLVFLTKAYEDFLRKKYPNMKVSLVNRLAKLEEIIDWESEKGKRIIEAREMSGKWKDLPLKDNKFIVSIYYQELKGRRGEQGVIQRGVPLFQYHPKTKEPFFEKIPEWIFKQIISKCESFDVI